MPYSFRRRPLLMAISRRAMLCSLEPVKCCRAAPHSFGSTTRRSTCRSSSRRIEALVGPWASTSLTTGNRTKCSVASAGITAAARISMSPMVSFIRRTSQRPRRTGRSGRGGGVLPACRQPARRPRGAVGGRVATSAALPEAVGLRVWRQSPERSQAMGSGRGASSSGVWTSRPFSPGSVPATGPIPSMSSSRSTPRGIACCSSSRYGLRQVRRNWPSFWAIDGPSPGIPATGFLARNRRS